MENKKRKIIKNLQKTRCRLRSSKIDGVGVFAIRNIKKRELIFPGMVLQKWIKFKKNELKNLSRGVLKMIDDFFVIKKDGSLRIPQNGFCGMDISFYLNHSKKPNTKITARNNFNFRAVRDIKKNEEITVDYRTYDAKFK